MGYVYFRKNTEEHCPICGEMTKHRLDEECGGLDDRVFYICQKCGTASSKQRDDDKVELETVREHHMKRDKNGEEIEVINYTCKQCGKQVKNGLEATCRYCGAELDLTEIHLRVPTHKVMDILGESRESVRKRGREGQFDAYLVAMSSYEFDSGLIFSYMRERKQ